MNPETTHIILDIWVRDAEEILDNERMKKIMEEAVKVSGSTVVGYTEKKFEPYGFSAVWLIAESHFSIHTFPEEHYISMDLYTCGNTDVEKACDFILSHLNVDYALVQYVGRGIKMPKYRHYTVRYM